MGVMSDFDPDDVKLPNHTHTVHHPGDSRTVTGMNPNTGELLVDGRPSNLWLSVHHGGSVTAGPRIDHGIDQDLNQVSPRPRSFADVGGIDQLEG